MLANDLQDGRRAEVELVEQEIVGMNCLRAERAERRSREVSQVRGDDSVRPADDRRSDDVPIVLVR